MIRHEGNNIKIEIPTIAAIGIAASAIALGVALADKNRGFDEEEAAKDWAPPPIEQNSDSMDTIDYGLRVNENGTIEVVEGLPRSIDGADEPGEDGPKIEPLNPGEYAEDPNVGN